MAPVLPPFLLTSSLSQPSPRFFSQKPGTCRPPFRTGWSIWKPSPSYSHLLMVDCLIITSFFLESRQVPTHPSRFGVCLFWFLGPPVCWGWFFHGEGHSPRWLNFFFISPSPSSGSSFFLKEMLSSRASLQYFHSLFFRVPPNQGESVRKPYFPPPYRPLNFDWFVVVFFLWSTALMGISRQSSTGAQTAGFPPES